MAKRLTAQLCLQAQAPVKARLNVLKPSIEKFLSEAEIAFRTRDNVSFNKLVREIVVYESEYDLLDLTSYSLTKLVKDAAAFGPPSNIAPVEVAQNFGVVVFASEICKIPELVTLRKSIFCHYGVNEATCALAILPGGGAGPGESKKLHNIIIPKTLVDLYDPRFKPSLAAAIQKRQEKLLESYSQKAPARGSPQMPPNMRKTASPYPQIPSQPQQHAPSPFPSIPQQAQQPAPSPFPQIPPTNMRTSSNGSTQRYSANTTAQRKSATVSQFPSVPQNNPEMFPAAPTAAPRPKPAPQREEYAPAPRAQKEEIPEPVITPVVQTDSPKLDQSESGHNPRKSGLFLIGKIKNAFTHTRKDDSFGQPMGQSNQQISKSSPPRLPSPVTSAPEGEKPQPAEPTPENGDVVSLSSSDVEIQPQTLSFGVSSRQAPVGAPLTEELVVKNKHKQTIIVLLERVNNASVDFKYELSFSHPVAFALKGGAEEKVVATLNILCTTKLEMGISVKTWKEKARSYKEAIMSFATESQLTTKLDPDELKRDELIGEGAYGLVFSGRYRGMDVAIKVVKNQEYMTPEMKADFASEVDMMEKLRHNAILNFVGAVHLPGHLSIVTELCQYGSFLSSMKKYPNDFTEALRVKCLLDASNGMDFLHQSGIVHRDLKPDNLLMVSLEPRSSVVAKLSDFGTTRDVNCFASQMQSTKGVGTPLFMAPEIFMNKPYDKAVDIYSFSLIIYVAFATELPFEGDPISFTPWAYADAIKNGVRPKIPPSCPSDIAKMMVKCWDNEPSKRPSFEDIHLFFRKFYKEHYPQ